MDSRRVRLGAGGVALSLAVCLMALTGCGGAAGSKVTGKATAGGQAVTGGTLTFAPLGGGEKDPGAPASAQIGADGSFTTATGMKAGKARVTYVPPTLSFPEGYTPKASEPAPVSPFTGMVPKEQEIEIKANTPVNVELVKPGGR